MTTARDLVTSALKKAGVIGVGQTASAEDANDLFDDLNDMMSQWAVERWLVYHLVDVPLVSTGAQSYTVGPGGDFNVTARPDRLEAAFVRYLGGPLPIDYPLKLIQAREDYNRIALKTLGAWPQAIFYDAAFPLGSVYPWMVPPAGSYELHLTLKDVLSTFATLDTAVSLPPVYNAAIRWNLAATACISYAIQPPPGIVAKAKVALNIIRNSNAQIPELRMPASLPGRRRGTSLAGFYSGYTS